MRAPRLSWPKAPLATLACLPLVLLASACGGGEASPGEETPALSVEPALIPGFSWEQSDYVVRCRDSAVSATIETPSGWEASVAGSEPRAGTFTVSQPLATGKAFRVAFSKEGSSRRVFNVRCLPNDFPPFEASGSWSAAPRLTVVEMINRYAVALDHSGTPIWWFQAPDGDPGDAKFLPDGTLAYAPVSGFSANRYVVRGLGGNRIRELFAGNGLRTDSHDLQLLPNGNYLLGAHLNVPGVDTKEFGGKRDSVIDTARIEELTPAGDIVWRWDAYPRISLRETGRWWKTLRQSDGPYDVNHWNSVERRGNRILLSFRHLDGVYCVDRRSGRILWKLGGTKTPRSLKVIGDPRGKYPLGGQHDARFFGRDSITVFDNATNLKPRRPRAVRYRIDVSRGTATFEGQVIDRRTKFSIGFGSARLDRKGNWTVGWGAIGQNGIVGVYPADGEPSRFSTEGGVTYRANVVDGPTPSITSLRAAMDRQAR